jgi:hypothetical protein
MVTELARDLRDLFFRSPYLQDGSGETPVL